MLLPKVLMARVQKRLITPTQKHEFSALVERLLKEWLAEGGKLPELPQ